MMEETGGSVPRMQNRAGRRLGPNNQSITMRSRNSRLIGSSDSPGFGDLANVGATISFSQFRGGFARRS